MLISSDYIGIKNTKKSRVVAFFGTTEDFVYFQEHSGDFDVNRYIWISSELWLRSDLIGISKSVKHILSIIPDQGDYFVSVVVNFFLMLFRVCRHHTRQAEKLLDRGGKWESSPRSGLI